MIGHSCLQPALDELVSSCLRGHSILLSNTDLPYCLLLRVGERVSSSSRIAGVRVEGPFTKAFAGSNHVPRIL